MPETSASQTGPPIKVLLIDDHDFFRAGVRSVLTEEGFDVVGEGASGDVAVPLAQRRLPDVILMDLNMPGVSGTEAIARLTAAGVSAPVVVLTVSSSEGDLIEALEAGAAGYLLKNAPPDEIAGSIRAAAEGDTPLSPAVARHLVERSRARGVKKGAASHAPQTLSTREIDVLRLLADGLDNGQIGAELYLSPATVKRDVSAILAKLGVNNRVQAAIEGVQSGLI